MANSLETKLGALSATGFVPGAREVKSKGKLRFNSPKVSKGKWKKRLKEVYSQTKKIGAAFDE